MTRVGDTNLETLLLVLQYGGDDGIDRDEFAVLLGNIDGFDNVAADCRRVRETTDRKPPRAVRS